jgi:hypothetical protein
MTEAGLDAGERYKISLYFLDLHGRYLLVVLFVGLILVGNWSGKLILLFGLVWAGGAAALSMQRPSDVEIDALFSRDLRSLTGLALSRLRPDDTEIMGPPCALFGPAVAASVADGRKFSRPRKGHDGLLRSPSNQAVILLPLEEQLGIFSCDYDSITGIASQVSVAEHHYRDVVSVRFDEGSAAVDRAVLFAAKPARRISPRPSNQVFSLALTNGRHLSVPVTVAWNEEVPAGAAAAATDLEKFVFAIRALMRDRQ